MECRTGGPRPDDRGHQPHGHVRQELMSTSGVRHFRSSEVVANPLPRKRGITRQRCCTTRIARPVDTHREVPRRTNPRSSGKRVATIQLNRTRVRPAPADRIRLKPASKVAVTVGFEPISPTSTSVRKPGITRIRSARRPVSISQVEGGSIQLFPRRQPSRRCGCAGPRCLPPRPLAPWSARR